MEVFDSTFRKICLHMNIEHWVYNLNKYELLLFRNQIRFKAELFLQKENW
jgi:hypothetical protein